MDDSGSSEVPKFSTEEWELVKELVFESESRDTHDLSAWLDGKGLSDKVRQEVERLLRSAQTCGEFLQRPDTVADFPPARQLPAQIGRYRVIEEIGSGGMGLVYAAFDEQLNRRVAIKVLLAQTAEDPSQRKRLRWDAQAASALQHPNIVTVHEVGSDDRSDYVVMECIAGRTLGRMIPTGGMETAEVLRYAIQIAAGLEAAHQASIVHRDLKPGNIMVTDTGVVKLLDFGLAKGLGAPFRTGDAPSTIEGKFAGTVAYVSPEQAEGKAVDFRSDVFSFGAVLFEMLTGRRAFPGESPISVLADILHTDPPSAIEFRAQIDPRVDEIVQRCLRKDRARRFQTIGEVGIRLREVEEEIQYARQDRSKTLSGIHPQVSGRPTAGLLYGAVIGAVVTAVLAAGLFFAIRKSDKAPAPTAAGQYARLTRATSDAGRTDFPSLSPDNKLLAYASDRSGAGNMDIWIQQMKDGELHQLTHGPENDYDPAFSPDGSKLVYRSERDGGGVYIMPSVGGSERLLGPKGRGARFSPDGQSVAFWTGEVGGSFNPGSAQIYIVPVRTGAPPQKFRPDFPASAYPVWSPRGDRLLFVARQQAGNPNDAVVDWWVASIDGTYAHRTHLLNTAAKAGLRPLPQSFWLSPAAWLASGKVLFSALHGDATNIWSVALTEDGISSDAPQRLTAGTTIEQHPTVNEANGHLELAFATQALSMDVWRVRLDARGAASGAAERLITGFDTISSPSTSWDGSRIAFASHVPEGQAIRILRAGKLDIATTLDSKTYARPVLSGDGEIIAYSDSKNGYIRHISSGQTQRICDACSLPTHVSFDGREVLFESLDAADQMWVCSASNPRRTLIEWTGKPALRLSGARFSPNGRWVVFSGSPFGTSVKHLWITPVRKEGPAKENELIPFTDGGSAETEPYWSPNGRTIYYLSDKDGFLCIWARSVDPVTAQAGSAAFPVAHFHQPTRTIQSPSPYLGDIGLSVAKDSLIFMMATRQSNIWRQTEPDRTR